MERRVERGGKRIELTSKEFGLLEYLMLNAGRRVTRAMIVEHVWNLSFDTCTNVVDVYVNDKMFGFYWRSFYAMTPPAPAIPLNSVPDQNWKKHARKQCSLKAAWSRPEYRPTSRSRVKVFS